MVTPPIEIKKAVVLRAIHGKNATPRLPAKTWSDIVKSGVAQKGLARRQSGSKPLPVKIVRQPIPRPASNQVPPKTPRSKAAVLAPSTGHADSPVTIVIGKKKHVVKTPKSLPKKGRKSLKVARKSMGKTRYSGVADLFTTPPSANKSRHSSVGTPHSLYSELPDTPDGPGEMFVSPLSASTASKSRESLLLSGVKELFRTKKQKAEPTYEGIKRLMATPKQQKIADQADVSPTGLTRLFPSPHKTPKQKTPAKAAQEKTLQSPDGTKESEEKSSTKVRGKTRVTKAALSTKTPSPPKPRLTRRGKKTPPKKALKTKIASPVKAAIHVQEETMEGAKPETMKTHSGAVATVSPIKPASPVKARSTRRGAKSTKSPAKVDTHVGSASSTVEVPVKLASPVKIKGQRAKTPSKAKTTRRGAKTALTPTKVGISVAKTPSPPKGRATRGSRAAHKTPVSVKKLTSKESLVTKSSAPELSPVKPATPIRKLTRGKAAAKISSPRKTTPAKPRATKGRKAAMQAKEFIVTPLAEPPLNVKAISPLVSLKISAQPGKGTPKASSPIKARFRRGRKAITPAKKTSPRKIEQDAPEAVPSPVKGRRGTRAKPVSENPATPAKSVSKRKAEPVQSPSPNKIQKLESKLKATSPKKASAAKQSPSRSPLKPAVSLKSTLAKEGTISSPQKSRRGTRAKPVSEKPGTPLKSASKRKAEPLQSTSPNKIQKIENNLKASSLKQDSPAKQSTGKSPKKPEVSLKSTLAEEGTRSSPQKSRRGTRGKPVSEKGGTPLKSAAKRKAEPVQSTSPNKMQKTESTQKATSPKKASSAKQSTGQKSTKPAVSPKSSMKEKGTLSSPNVPVSPAKGRKATRRKAATPDWTTLKNRLDVPTYQSPERKQKNQNSKKPDSPTKALTVKQTRGKKKVSPVKGVQKKNLNTDSKDVSQKTVKATPAKRTRGKANTASPAKVPATTKSQVKTASPAKMLAKGKTLIKSPVVTKRVTRARK